MSKHTPGPWIQDKHGSIVDCNGDGVSFRGVSTLCAGTKERIEEAEANTILACAAPDLLEALESANDQMQMAYACVEDGRYDEALLHLGSMSRIRHAALSKAKGEKRD